MSDGLDKAIQTFNTKISEALKRAVAKDTATPILRLFLKDKTLKENGKTLKQRPGKDFIDNLSDENLNQDKTAQTIKENFEKIGDGIFKKTDESGEKNIDWKEVKNNPETYAQVCKNTITEINNFINDVKKHLTSIQENKLLKRLEKCIAQIKILQKAENLKSKSKDNKVDKDISDAINNIMKLKSKTFIKDINQMYTGENLTKDQRLATITQLQSPLKKILGYEGGTPTNEVKKLGYDSIAPIQDCFSKDYDIDKLTNNQDKITYALGKASNKAIQMVSDSLNNNRISTTQSNALHAKINKLFTKGITSLNNVKTEPSNDPAKEETFELSAKHTQKLNKLLTKYNDQKSKSRNATKLKKDTLEEAIRICVPQGLRGYFRQKILQSFIKAYKKGKFSSNDFFKHDDFKYDETTLNDVLRSYKCSVSNGIATFNYKELRKKYKKI